MEISQKKKKSISFLLAPAIKLYKDTPVSCFFRRM